MVSVIIPAGGAGTRMGAAVRKQYLMLAGQPVLARTVQVFIDHPEVDEIVVAVPAGDLQEVVGMLSRQRGAKRVQVVEGGSDRQASVAAALAAVAPDSATVLVHDAVRPLVAPDVISAVLVVARTGAVSAARPVQETIKVCVDEKVQETLDRSKLWAMQTPQGFPRALLERAHAAAAAGHDVRATDDCALVERLGEPVHIVLGNTENIKLTTPADLALAQRL
ncbi:MAG: 2-C-methyl-D-erythritol 4-phosphate cytidylyltransferase, partial [Kiritimatiellia bacterium]